jgi:hypothetical protein
MLFPEILDATVNGRTNQWNIVRNCFTLIILAFVVYGFALTLKDPFGDWYGSGDPVDPQWAIRRAYPYWRLHGNLADIASGIIFFFTALISIRFNYLLREYRQQYGKLRLLLKTIAAYSILTIFGPVGSLYLSTSILSSAPLTIWSALFIGLWLLVTIASFVAIVLAAPRILKAFKERRRVGPPASVVLRSDDPLRLASYRSPGLADLLSFGYRKSGVSRTDRVFRELLLSSRIILVCFVTAMLPILVPVLAGALSTETAEDQLFDALRVRAISFNGNGFSNLTITQTDKILQLKSFLTSHPQIEILLCAAVCGNGDKKPMELATNAVSLVSDALQRGSPKIESSRIYIGEPLTYFLDEWAEVFASRPVYVLLRAKQPNDMNKCEFKY